MKRNELAKTKMPSRENLRHPFLLIAATGVMSFNYDAVRRIYDLFIWHVTPIETHIQEWLKKGWLVGEPVYHYRTSAHVRIAPLVWIDVLRGIDPKELDELQRIALDVTKKGPSVMATLTKALCLFLHNLPFADELAAIDEVSSKDMNAMEPYLNIITTSPELRPYLCQCPERLLSQCFYMLLPRLIEGSVQMTREELDQLFFKNERLPEVSRQLWLDSYLYNVEFLRRGCLEDSSGGQGALRALAEITRLRQAACHPRLIPNDKLPKAAIRFGRRVWLLLVLERMIRTSADRLGRSWRGRRQKWLRRSWPLRRKPDLEQDRCARAAKAYSQHRSRSSQGW